MNLIGSSTVGRYINLVVSLNSIIHIGDKTEGCAKRNYAIILYNTLEPKSVLLL